MSRGLGKLQLDCMDVLKRNDGMLNSLDIAVATACSEQPTPAHVSATRRALRTLARRGTVVDLGRSWRWGRRMWALPEKAKEYRERYERVFHKKFWA